MDTNLNQIKSKCISENKRKNSYFSTQDLEEKNSNLEIKRVERVFHITDL